ncbi:MAG: metallophosphoesterase family protein, partial [Isosphaeraceae bacterium]
MIHRRTFLASSVITSIWPLAIPASANTKPLKIGLISDIHKDIIHDADDRLKTFIDEMQLAHVDAILQLGDFCIPKPANEPFLDIFNRFEGPKYHCIGNHDTDGGFKRDDTVKFWRMPSRFYSFDLGGFHFIVLDANDKPPGHKGGYPKFIADDQLQWLEMDLRKTSLNTFIFSHQSLERPDCIINQADVRALIQSAKTETGQQKVSACFNGHWHIDHARNIANIPYIHINSASYIWLNDPKVRGPRLSPELSRKFPTVASTIPY